LVLLVIGAIEFGILYYNKQVIVNASREGARAGIIAYNTAPTSYYRADSAIEDLVEFYCEHHLIAIKNPHDSVQITLTPGSDYRANPGFTFESPFTVKVEYFYDFFLPSIFGQKASMTITGITTMLNQHVIE